MVGLQNQAGPGPLDGIRVVEIGRWIAAPMCAAQLADLGADVVKVESPRGDDSRTAGTGQGGVSGYFAHYNRGKRSVVLDLRQEADLESLEQLLADADVLIHNYRPVTAQAMGLDFPAVSTRHPHLIVVAISGYGADAPDQGKGVFDAIAQAAGGMMSRTGAEGDPPALIPGFPVDQAAGMTALAGTLAALHERARTGRGNLVDVSLLDAAVHMLGPVTTTGLMTGHIPERAGNRDPVTAPGNLFECGDGHVYIDAGTDTLFEKLARLMDREDLLTDVRFADQAARVHNAIELEAAVTKWTAARPSSAVVRQLESVGVPCGRVGSVADVLREEDVRRRLVVPAHCGDATFEAVGSGVRVGLGAPRRPAAVPLLGEHTAEVLSEVKAAEGRRSSSRATAQERKPRLFPLADAPKTGDKLVRFELMDVGQRLGPVTSVIDERVIRNHQFSHDIQSGPIYPTVLLGDLLRLLNTQFSPLDDTGLHQREEVWLSGELALGDELILEGGFTEKYSKRGRGYVVTEATARRVSDGVIVCRHRATESTDIGDPREVGAGRATDVPRRVNAVISEQGRRISAIAAAAVGDWVEGTRRRITQEQISIFSNVAAFWKTIHTDEETALEAGLPGPVAQGLITAGYLSEMAGSLFPGWSQNGHLELAFVKPVYSGDLLVPRGNVIDSSDDGRHVLEVWVEKLESQVDPRSVGPVTVGWVDCI